MAGNLPEPKGKTPTASEVDVAVYISNICAIAAIYSNVLPLLKVYEL